MDELTDVFGIALSLRKRDWKKEQEDMTQQLKDAREQVNKALVTFEEEKDNHKQKVNHFEKACTDANAKINEARRKLAKMEALATEKAKAERDLAEAKRDLAKAELSHLELQKEWFDIHQSALQQKGIAADTLEHKRRRFESDLQSKIETLTAKNKSLEEMENFLKSAVATLEASNRYLNKCSDAIWGTKGSYPCSLIFFSRLRYDSELRGAPLTCARELSSDGNSQISFKCRERTDPRHERARR
jgi:DNA repair exonuclease SbcCD ATPase subunit